MKQYSYLILLDVKPLTDELQDQIYDAGFDDCLVAEKEEEVYIRVDREDESLEECIKSATDTLAAMNIPIAAVIIQDPFF